MKTRFKLVPFVAAVIVVSPTFAANIDTSTITQVVNDVSIIQRASKAKTTARVNATFGAPDIMKTGPNSRAEMMAPDQTITRVGANTLFSFEPSKREINLQQGSVLFNSPPGNGGGTIKTAAASASVLGTTMVFATTPNGGFKVLLLEGTGRVRTTKGGSRTLGAGQMVYALPGGGLSGVLTFQLHEQVSSSLLAGGFKQKLGSQAKIDAAIAKQDALFASGKLQKTGLLAGNAPGEVLRVDTTVQVEQIEQTMEPPPVVENAPTAADFFASDAIIDSPFLEAQRIFASDAGAPAFLSSAFQVDFDVPLDLSFFVARNATVLTDSIDLSPYEPATFVFLMAQDFVLTQDVTIGGTNSPVAIVTGGTLRQTPGAFLAIDAPDAFVFLLDGSVPEFLPPGLTIEPAAATLSMVDGGIISSGNLFVMAAAANLDGSLLSADGGVLDVQTTGTLNAVGFGVPDLLDPAAESQFFAESTLFFTVGGDLRMLRSLSRGESVDVAVDGSLLMNRSAMQSVGGDSIFTIGGDLRLNRSALVAVGGDLFIAIDGNVNVNGPTKNIESPAFGTPPPFFATGDIGIDAGGSFTATASVIGGNRFIVLAVGRLTLDTVEIAGSSSLDSFGRPNGTARAVRLFSDAGISLTDTGIKAGNVQISGNNIAAARLSVAADNVRFVAAKNMLVNRGNFFGATAATSSVVVLSAGSTLGISNVNFQAQSVALAAQTVVLRNVDFNQGSRVLLRSASGQIAPQPNTGQPVRFGDVNFIRNVTYGGVPVQQQSGGSNITVKRL